MQTIGEDLIHVLNQLRSVCLTVSTVSVYVSVCQSVCSGVFKKCTRRGPRGFGGRKSPSGVHPGRGSVPQKLKLFC